MDLGLDWIAGATRSHRSARMHHAAPQAARARRGRRAAGAPPRLLPASRGMRRARLSRAQGTRLFDCLAPASAASLAPRACVGRRRRAAACGGAASPASTRWRCDRPPPGLAARLAGAPPVSRGFACWQGWVGPGGARGQDRPRASVQRVASAAGRVLRRSGKGCAGGSRRAAVGDRERRREGAGGAGADLFPARAALQRCSIHSRCAAAAAAPAAGAMRRRVAHVWGRRPPDPKQGAPGPGRFWGSLTRMAATWQRVVRGQRTPLAHGATLGAKCAEINVGAAVPDRRACGGPAAAPADM